MRNLHLHLAHHIWEEHIKQASIVIDATAGNGHDAYFLAETLSRFPGSQLHIFDIQKEAIESTQKKIDKGLFSSRLSVTYYLQSHFPFPATLSQESVDLIIYNLGYLPGGDKSITTLAEFTLPSIEQALSLLKKGGVLSLTCYPGHEEGKLEYDQILKKLELLQPEQYTIYKLEANKPLAPQLIAIRKDQLH